jgi:LmeA-like phospholipid-binding
LLVVLLVFLVLLVAADRIGNYLAERTAAKTLQSSQHLPNRPDVDVAGFPFLTQLAAGNFDQVTVTARDVPVGQKAHLLDISRLKVVLHDVAVARDFSRVTADTAKATATVSFAELGRTLGIGVRYAGGDRIKATKTVTALGNTVQASVTTRPALVNGALGFTATAVSGAGELGAEVTSALNSVFDLAVPLQGMPFKIRVQSLRVDGSGLHIQLTGRHLSYSH